jgi:hypothetical protein
MARRVLLAATLWIALFLTSGAPGVSSPVAANCLSAGQVRAAVQGGQAIPLSSVLGQIRATGQVLSSPQLCNMGGRLVYLVNVLVDGRVTHLQVDAQSGSISQ